MIRDAYFIALHDLSYLLRRRETLLWTFVMPIIFFYFIGTATGGFGRSAEPDAISVSAPPDSGFLADELIKRLELRNFRVVRGEGGPRQIRIPAGFTSDVLAGNQVKVELTREGAGINTSYDQARVARAVYTLLADFNALSLRGIAPTPDAFAALSREPAAISVEVRSAGKRKDPPVGFSQTVPGILVMFVLLVLFTSGGVSLAVERRQGILRRLASSPMSRGGIVLGKFGARLLLAFVQIAFAMITGTVLFRVNWGEHIGSILLVLAAYASLASLLGLLLGNLAKSDGQVVGFGVIASNVMAALGGCWWPIEITPPWTQRMALFLPTGWAMDALHKLMNFGDSGASVLPHIAAFLVLASIAGFLLTKTFRFQ